MIFTRLLYAPSAGHTWFILCQRGHLGRCLGCAFSKVGNQEVEIDLRVWKLPPGEDKAGVWSGKEYQAHSEKHAEEFTQG